MVHLQPPDPREVVALRVEEEVVEEVRRRVEGRRIARAQAPVDLDDRLVLGERLVREQGVAQRRAGGERVEDRAAGTRDAARLELVEVCLGELLVALDDDLAGVLVDDVDRRDALDRVGADQVVGVTWIHSIPASELAHAAAVNLRSLRTRRCRVVADLRVQRWPISSSRARHHFLNFLPSTLIDLGLVEVAEQLLRRVAERLQQDRHVDLAAPVDARVEQILVVELDVEPRAAVGNDPAGVDLLARRR